MSTNGAPASASPIEGPVVSPGGSPQLLGSVCPACGTHEFPVQRSCARCGTTMETALLPRSGAVWSWTVQRLRPKRIAGDGFEPFALGYVDLGPLKIETRFAGKPFDTWQIGDRVELAAPGPDDPSDPPYWFVPEATA